MTEKNVATRNAAAAVLAGGMAAAALDIVNAMLFWWVYREVPPVRILQSIAAGLLGKASFSAGAGSAALGALLHLFIACGMAWTYVVLARRLPRLAQRPLVSGTLFGLGAYVVMTYMVVPLSRANPVNPYFWWTVDSVAAHVLLVGVPVALIARRLRAA